MSWQIPQQVEKDRIAGKAQYRTFQTGVGGQSILPVPPNAYAVIFGYDFSPAGGGLIANQVVDVTSPDLNEAAIRFFETQQISFYTGTDFYPFIHHINTEISVAVRQIQNNVPPAVNTTILFQEFNVKPGPDVRPVLGFLL